MTKQKTKQTHKEPKEVMADLSEEKELGIDKECVEEIDAVLKKYNRALDPFVIWHERGAQARVRIVRVPAKPVENGEEAEA